MRNLLILVLGAAVVWLLIERGRLTEEATVAKAELEKSQKTVEVYVRQVGVLTSSGVPAAAAPGRKESWLDAHLDKGAKALAQPEKH